MSEDGQIATIGFGALIGGAIAGGVTGGMGFSQGAMWGAYIGGMIGSFLFPPQMKEPDKLKDYGMNTAETGIPIPLVYGTTKIAGNYIWKGKLTSDPIYQDVGGKGGSKQKVGYTYFMEGALGLCRGEAEMGRYWENNEQRVWQGRDSITFYAGTTDQTVNSVYSGRTDDAVAFRGTAYILFDDHLLGENSATAPNIQVEMHRYPFDTNAGSHVAVYNHYASITDSTGGVGLAVKDSSGTIWVIDESNLEIKEYNKDMSTLENTIDITSLDTDYDFQDPSFPKEIGFTDADIIEVNNERILVLIWVSNITGGTDTEAYWATINLGRLKNTTTIPNVATSNANYINVGLIVSQSNSLGLQNFKITHNSTYTYISYYNNEESQFMIRRYTLSKTSVARTVGGESINVYAHTLTLDNTYDKETDLENTTTHMVGSICADDDYVFAITKTTATEWQPNRIIAYNADTMAKISYTDVSASATDAVATYCTLGVGSNEIITGGIKDDDRTLQLFSFTHDGTGNNITYQNNYDIDTYFDKEEAQAYDLVDSAYRSMKVWGALDGTLVISTGDTVSASVLNRKTVQILIRDANPSQICYDIFRNQLDKSVTDINISSFSTMSQYCVDNRIGLSFSLSEKQTARDVLRTIMTYVNGTIYQNNDGEYEAKVFKNNDSSEATLDKSDITNWVSITMKDRRRIANRLNFNYIDRLAKYTNAENSIDHFLSQEEDDEITEKNIPLIMISNHELAGKMIWRFMKWERYDTFIFEASLMPEHFNRLPGQVLTIDLTEQELNNQKIRLLNIGEPDFLNEGSVKIVARREESYLNTFEKYTIQKVRSEDNTVAFPVSVRPVIFELPSLWTNDQYAVGITCIRYDEDVVGCDVYLSYSDTEDFSFVGTIKNPAYSADISEIITDDFGDNRFNVDVSNYPDTLASYTVEEQRNDASFCVVGELQSGNCELLNSEFMSFREVETDGDILTLRNIYRGKYHTLPKAHDVTDVLLQTGKDRFFRYNFKQTDVGKPILIKCVAFNIRGIKQNLADVETFEYTVQGDTQRATHTSGIQIYDNSELRGSLYTVDTSDVTIKWRDTYRLGGIDRMSWGSWQYNSFVDGDVDDYEVIVYNNAKAFVVTHVLGSAVTEYEYTKEQNNTDFGSLTTEFYLGVKPLNSNEGVDDIDKIYIKLNV